MQKEEQKQKASENWVKVYAQLGSVIKLPVGVALPVLLFRGGLSACLKKDWQIIP
jgi:hypothetical protein